MDIRDERVPKLDVRGLEIPRTPPYSRVGVRMLYIRAVGQIIVRVAYHPKGATYHEGNKDSDMWDTATVDYPPDATTDELFCEWLDSKGYLLDKEPSRLDDVPFDDMKTILMLQGIVTVSEPIAELVRGPGMWEAEEEPIVV